MRTAPAAPEDVLLPSWLENGHRPDRFRLVHTSHAPDVEGIEDVTPVLERAEQAQSWRGKPIECREPMENPRSVRLWERDRERSRVITDPWWIPTPLYWVPGRWFRLTGADWVKTPDVPTWWPRWIVEERHGAEGVEVLTDPMPTHEALTAARRFAGPSGVVKAEFLPQPERLNPRSYNCPGLLVGPAPAGWSRYEWTGGVLLLLGEAGRARAGIMAGTDDAGVYEIGPVNLEGQGDYAGDTMEDVWATWTPEARALAPEVARHVLDEFGLTREQLDDSWATAKGVPLA